jgi:hypothetical protein
MCACAGIWNSAESAATDEDLASLSRWRAFLKYFDRESFADIGSKFERDDVSGWFVDPNVRNFGVEAGLQWQPSASLLIGAWRRNCRIKTNTGSRAAGVGRSSSRQFGKSRARVLTCICCIR